MFLSAKILIAQVQRELSQMVIISSLTAGKKASKILLCIVYLSQASETSSTIARLEVECCSLSCFSFSPLISLQISPELVVAVILQVYQQVSINQSINRSVSQSNPFQSTSKVQCTQPDNGNLIIIYFSI